MNDLLLYPGVQLNLYRYRYSSDDIMMLLHACTHMINMTGVASIRWIIKDNHCIVL